MKLENIGVIGAGVIGSDLALHLALTGHSVTLVDVSQAVLDNVEQSLKGRMRFIKMLSKKSIDATLDEVRERISFTTEQNELAQAQFVIENIPERWSLKQALYGQIDAICQPDCIFAANTSCIPITRIASVTGRPTKVLGMHFMNPVTLKPVVEVIRGFHTAPETLAAAESFLAQQGKQAVIVNDAPGFVSNRVLMLTINEAICLLYEQVSTAKNVDRIFTACFGHKMGPLETADLIGLDTILYSLEVLYDEFKDSKYRPCPLLVKLVDAGRLGKKSGAGFYPYANAS